MHTLSPFDCEIAFWNGIFYSHEEYETIYFPYMLSNHFTLYYFNRGQWYFFLLSGCENEFEHLLLCLATFLF